MRVSAGCKVGEVNPGTAPKAIVYVPIGAFANDWLKKPPPVNVAGPVTVKVAAEMFVLTVIEPVGLILDTNASGVIPAAPFNCV